MGKKPQYPEPFEYTLHYFKKALFVNETVGSIKDSEFWTNERLDWGGVSWLSRPRNIYRNLVTESLKFGEGEGFLYGGNIETLNLLVGTNYFKPPKDIIFFWEACEEEAFIPRVRRSLTHLKQVGFFDKVKGMLIGRCPDCKDFMDVSFSDLVLDIFSDYSFPIITNLPFGHTDPIVTLPIGVRCKVVADKNYFSVDFLQ